MNTRASFLLQGPNPDVLSCIAKLSNDEVFTPPELAGRMLDILAEAWAATGVSSQPDRQGSPPSRVAGRQRQGYGNGRGADNAT